MPRVPRPDEMPRAQLAGAGNPAQINIGVASAIGAAGRAQGQAIAAIGNAFGEVVGRIGQVNDANAFADAKLEFLKGDMAIQDDISRNVGEDGALWQSAGERYTALNKDIDSKYQISDPQRRRDFERWRETQTFERGIGAAKQYQGAQRGLLLKNFDADVAGLEERIQKGEIDQATIDEYYGTLTEKLNSMSGRAINRTDAEAKTRELQGRMVGSIDRYLARAAPGERAAFWDQVTTKGQYEVDQPQQSGRAGDAKTFLRSKLALGYEKRTSDVDNLHPVMQDRLAALTAAAEDAGHDVRIISGHRDASRQAVLWQNALKKYGSASEARKHVAPPGGSSHQSGEAVDLQFGDRGAGLGGKRTAAVEWVHQNAKKYGLNFPLGHEDWHIEPIEARQGGKRYGGSYDTSKTYWQGGRVAGGDQSARIGSGAASSAGASAGDDDDEDDNGSAAARPSLATRVAPKDFFGPDIKVDELPAGMRNHNPGNLKWSGSAYQRKKYPGMIGPSENKDEGTPQIEFASPQDGMAAMAVLALDKYDDGLDTVEKIIRDPTRGWTPGAAGKMAPGAVARMMGISPNDKINLRDPATMNKFMRALITQEHGPDSKLYTDDLIQAGVQAAMGGGESGKAGAPQAPASPSPGMVARPANDNRSAPAPLLEPSVMGQLSQADGKQLASEVVPMDVLTQLADKSEAVAGVENLETMTVDELRKIAAEHEVQGLDARANGTGGGVIPQGRLVAGQTFTVNTPKGEFKVPAEWINSLSPKMRAEYARKAKQENALYQRQLKADADEMIKNQEAHVAEFGKNAPDYDIRAVQAAYGNDPKKLKAHASRLRIGKAIYDEFRDAASLPDDEIVARLERIRPEMDSPQFAESKAIFERAEKRLDLLMKQRAIDPGAAVEKSKDVMQVRERLVGGAPRNKFDWQALMMARLDAQRRLDISEEARSPLTGNELRALAAPLRGMEPEQAAERIEQVHAGVKEKYGEKFSGVIMRKVVETTVKDKERRQSFGAMLTELEEENKISPTTLNLLRKRQEIGAQEKQIAPKPAAAPSFYSRVLGMMPGTQPGGALSGNYRPGLQSMPPEPLPPEPLPPSGPRRTPPREAVDMLKANPGSMRQFESTFGLSPGEGRKYLLKE